MHYTFWSNQPCITFFQYQMSICIVGWICERKFCQFKAHCFLEFKSKFFVKVHWTTLKCWSSPLNLNFWIHVTNVNLCLDQTPDTLTWLQLDKFQLFITPVKPGSKRGSKVRTISNDSCPNDILRVNWSLSAKLANCIYNCTSCNFFFKLAGSGFGFPN